jgi:hypothetical protein
VSVVVAYVFYRSQVFDKKQHKFILIAFRSLGLFALLALLLQPILRFTQTKEDKPIILVFVDKSQSINKDEIPMQAWQTMMQRELTQYDIQWQGFAGDVFPIKDSIDGSGTNLYNLNKYISTLERDNNLAAAIVISDGIATQGGNPIYPNHKLPVFTMGLGNPAIIPDIRVLNVVVNKSIYKGNETTLETNIQAIQCQGSSVNISLYDGDVKVAEKLLSITDNTFSSRLEFTIKPQGMGKHIYTVRATAVKGETNTNNNAKTALLQVEDNQKIINLIFHGPHPDLGALKMSLQTHKTYVTKTGNPDLNINPAEIYILHGYPQTAQEATFIQKLYASKAPFWLIASSTTYLNQWNGFTPQLTFASRGAASNLAAAAPNDAFTEIFIEPSIISAAAKFPPLKTPYASITAGAGLKTLFTQKIGSVNTNTPLWAFAQRDEQRSVFLMGEGLWRWRLAEYKNTKDWKATDELILKTIQYLATATIKNGFQTYPSSTTWDQGQNVVLHAEFTDESGEKVNEYPAEGNITSPDGKKLSVEFAPYQDIYRANIGSLPPGKYAYSANLGGGKQASDNSFFVVLGTNPELDILQANHDILKQWATNSKGQFATTMPTIIQAIKQNLMPQIRLREINKTKSILEFWPYFAIIIVCFSVEWFLRKYLGKY